MSNYFKDTCIKIEPGTISWLNPWAFFPLLLSTVGIILTLEVGKEWLKDKQNTETIRSTYRLRVNDSDFNALIDCSLRALLDWMELFSNLSWDPISSRNYPLTIVVQGKFLFSAAAVFDKKAKYFSSFALPQIERADGLVTCWLSNWHIDIFSDTQYYPG